MFNLNWKKFLVGSSLVLPSLACLTAVVSCSCSSSATDEQKAAVQDDFEGSYIDENGVIYSSSAIQRDEDWGQLQYQDPQTSLQDENNQYEYLERQQTMQPFSIHYHPRDLQDWDPTNDPDALFNKSVVPLQESVKADPILATQNSEYIYSVLDTFSRQTSRTPASTTGYDDTMNYLLNIWQFSEFVVNFGGSSTEGLILVPKGQDTDAAHKNGVKMLGNIFVPPDTYGGNEQMYQDLVVKDDQGNFVNAQKLVDIAIFYGFDGWFLNLEAEITNSSLASDLGDFIDELYELCQENGLVLNLYDFGEGNKYFDEKNFDYFSIDFYNRDGYTTKNNDDTIEMLGYDFGTNGLNNLGRDEGGPFSLDDIVSNNADGLWVYKMAECTGFDIEGELAFYVDSEGNRDPRYQGTDNWIEIGKYFLENTTITGRQPFSTSFETGKGWTYSVQGNSLSLGSNFENQGFKNASLQDFLPTYTWIVDLVDPNGKILSDYGEYTQKQQIDIVETQNAYNGINSVSYNYQGISGSTVVNKLFACDLDIEKGDTFQIVVSNEQSPPQLAIWYDNLENTKAGDDSKAILVEHTNSQVIDSEYTVYYYELQDQSNIDFSQNIKSFGVALEADNEGKIDNVLLHQMSFVPKEGVSNYDNVHITSVINGGDAIFEDSRNARICWSVSDATSISKYAVYLADEDFEKIELLQLTGSPVAFLEDLPSQSEYKLVIEAYDEFYNLVLSEKVVLKTSFGPMNDDSKWEVEYSQSDEIWTYSTVNGYTYSFQDTNGDIFLGDNRLRLHKISSDGDVCSDGDDNWGEVLVDYQDTTVNTSLSINNIFEAGNDQIFVTTQREEKSSSGMEIVETKLILVDKITGESQEIETFNNQRITNIFQADGKSFLVIQNDDSWSVVSLESDGSYDFIVESVPGTILEIYQTDSGFNAFIVEKSSENNSNNVIKKVTAKEEVEEVNEDTFYVSFNENFVETSRIKIDVSYLYEEIEEKLLAQYSDQIDSLAYVDTTTLEEISHSNIIWASEYRDKIYVINEWGLLLELAIDTNTSELVINEFVLLVDLNDLNQIAEETLENFELWNETHPLDEQVAGLVNIRSIQDVKEIVENQNSDFINPDLIDLDFENGQITICFAENLEYLWWGFTSIFNKIQVIDLDSFITSDGGYEEKSVVWEFVSSREENKKVDEIKIIEYVEKYDVYIVGSYTGKLIVLDSNLNQIYLTKREYYYDGKLISTSDVLLFESDNLEVPDYLKE